MMNECNISSKGFCFTQYLNRRILHYINKNHVMNLDTDLTEVIECFRKCFPYYVSEPERKIIKKYFRVRILYF